jgi:hypothetical protein
MDEELQDPFDADFPHSPAEPGEYEDEPPWQPSCPANNCERGTVELTERPDPEDDGSAVTGGKCDQCGTPAVQCAECGQLTALLSWEATPCDYCGETVYQKVAIDKKGIDFWFHRVS